MQPAFKGDRPGKEDFYWTIGGIFESECPVSSITQSSFDLVQIVNAMENAKEMTGSVQGADDMPGFMFDALRVVRASDLAIDDAREEANR